MKISRTVYVARTAHDKTNGNKLVVPEYGVIELRLKTDAKKSKSYLPKTSAPPRKPVDEGEDTFCFAPGTQWDDNGVEVPANTDKVKVWYHLYNPHSVITEAKLQLFRRFDKTAIWERDLKDDELLDGEHELEFDKADGSGKEKLWDGKIDAVTAEFPDQYITTEHSPYKLRLMLKGEGMTRSPMAWTFFHILIHELDLEWAPDEAVNIDADKRKPFKDVKALVGDPKSDAKIFLVSNLFKTADGDMTGNNLFTEYETLWDDGPEIAVVAKVWVRNSAGNKVLAPKALGETKFLWDWESKSVKSANAFVKDAADYLKKKSKPKGLNCHKDRGGKRDNDAKKVFPDQGGYGAADALADGSFPFEVKAVDEKRKWAAYSKAWRKGKLGGKTGVLFRPARMSGDAYKMTVYAAHEIEDDKRKPRLDIEDEAPLKIEATLKKDSGVFTVWRKLHFRAYMTKNGATTTGFAGIRAFFEPAFMDIEDMSGGNTTYPGGEWNASMTGIYNGWDNASKERMDPAVDQHGAGQHGLHFRTYDEWKALLTTSYAGFWPGYAGGMDKWLIDNNMDEPAKYAAACQSLALAALVTLFNAKLPADDGVSLFQVDNSINPGLIAAMDSYTDGLAANFPAGGQKKSAFLWTAPATAYNAAQGTSATPAHEIGHLLMLPHPRNAGENEGANKNNDYDAHDRKVKNCLMSYLAASREVCGLCQLRLRGWDKSQLKPGRKNAKS